jgi:CheY-like chemotaxis protein
LTDMTMMIEPQRPPLPLAATVLVIDDVDATRGGLATLLRLRGYRACEAGNAIEGLRILREERGVRAVMLDVMLPGASGFWFREQQLHDPAIANIPVILFTSAPDVDVDTTPLPVQAVVRKPLAVDTLLDLLSRYCAA